MKDIFLCHTAADKDWVRRLAERLEAEHIDGRPVAVWFDEWDIDGGENLLSKIDEGLKTSRFFSVVLSPAMTRADWPTMEWQTQVYQDPAGKKGRILPLLLHLHDAQGMPIEIPLPLSILKRYDFSNPKRFETVFQELLRRLRNQKPLRGQLSNSQMSEHVLGQEEPDDKTEGILSNLFPVTHMPEFIYSDEVTETDRKEIYAKTGAQIPFFIDGGRLFSFSSHDDQSNPFRSLLTARLRQKQKTSDWLADPTRRRRIIQLMNGGLSEHCYRLKIRRTEQSGDSFFVPVFGNTPRTFSWGSGRGRTLAKRAKTSTGEGFGVHHAARMRFISLGPKLFLLVLPGWYFTEDGFKPVAGKVMGVLSTRWGGRERNAAVLRNVLMWGLLLGNGEPTIRMRVGTDQVTVRCTPSTATASVGIDSDELRLDRVLSGEGAGEVAGDDELDVVAALREQAEEELEDVGDDDAPEAGEESQ